MSRCVLDASAILAVLLNEPGQDVLTDDVLSDAVASTVNLAEVQTSMVRRGIDPAEAWKRAVIPVSEVMPFTVDQAQMAGSLVAQTRSLGLSLGDRACLALALALKSPVYTADKSWKRLKLAIPVHVIR
ncbi:MAG TPA: type II toxin-antitoxin system VapC family toxin [Acidobacteriaceae bacterium]|jgi:PIN domain nuclease of toxin-antitoxin system|nr:type II toxin-antitoxin system VapC family toxin [Acidobacteriaceae bacterium]